MSIEPTPLSEPVSTRHLQPNPEADPSAWAAAHGRFLAAARRPGFPRPEVRAALMGGRYRFGLFDELGTRDTVAPVWTALHQFLRQAAPAGRESMAFVAAFRTPADSQDLFDALLWGQLNAMLELDRLLYPRAVVQGQGVLTASFGGRACVATGLRSPDDLLVLDFLPAVTPSGAPLRPEAMGARSRCV